MSLGLLDDETVRALEGLRLEVRRRLDGARVGERRALRRGASTDLAEHRPYAPGDDPRRIDWSALARLGELVVRLYTAEQDVTVHLLVDASRSMATGAPAKLDVALRLAAAVGYVCLHGSERVALTVCLDGDARAAPPMRGRRDVARLLAALDAVRPSGVARLSDVAAGLRRRRGARPGVAVIASDLLDDGDALDAALALAAARHEVVVAHVLSEADLSPALHGECALVDAESGEALELTVDAAMLRAYESRRDAWLADVRARLATRGARYVAAWPGRRVVDVAAEALGAPPPR